MSTMNDNQSTVGIVMPCYNLGPYIDAAVKSVLAQSFKNYTVYIVDDASTDKETVKTLQQLAKNLPDNFTVDFQVKNRGMHKVTNYAAKKIKADYLFIFSPDDELRETYLEETVSYLDKHPSTAAVCTWLEYFEEDTGIKKYSQKGCTLPSMLLENGFSGAAVIRKSVWDSAGGYDPHPSQKVHEDYNFWLGLLGDGYSLGVINKPLFRYRIRSQSISHSVDPIAEIAWMEYITSKYKNLFDQYASIIIPHIWREGILRHASYKETLAGHEWLDAEYKKQLKTIESLANENALISERIERIEANRIYRIMKRVRSLLSPLMRNKG